MSQTPRQPEIMEGSLAIAQAVQVCRPQVIAAYPITPQTHIVEDLAQMVADGELAAQYLRVDSEFSAASAICGASAAGVRTYTASSSQGLLLMTEVIYYLAGARLPVVITGANRQVAVPLGLQPDQQDTMSLRDTGAIQLYVESVQEAYDTHIQAFRLAEDRQVLLPVIVAVTGYVLTHVFEPVTLLSPEEVDSFLPPYQPVHYLDPANPMIFGSYLDETNLLEFRYTQQSAAERAKERVEAIALEFRRRFGRHYGGLLDCYRTEDAEVAFVAAGALVSTLRDVVDHLREEGRAVGLIKIRCFRPFPTEALRASVEKISALIVFDQAISLGQQGVLSAEVRAALYDAPNRPMVLGSFAAFGGREITLEIARSAVREALHQAEKKSPAKSLDFIGLRRDLLPEA